MFSSGSFVINDAVVGGQNDVTELSRGQQVGDDLFVFSDLNIESRGDNTALIDSAEKFDNNLSTSSVIDDFEVSNVVYCYLIIITLSLH